MSRMFHVKRIHDPLNALTPTKKISSPVFGKWPLSVFDLFVGVNVLIKLLNP